MLSFLCVLSIPAGMGSPIQAEDRFAARAPLHPAATGRSDELVYVDRGVVRWRASGQEVRLFGANYCLPSALDYRAAGAVGADRKALVRADMTHFARLGFDALRFSFWGDWESSDAAGNLVRGDRLDLLDYTLAVAKKRGIYFLLSPIVTYDARWPEMGEYPEAHGFSRTYDRGKLGTDLDALKAQVNYLRQFLNHVNPYTGVAWKEEPSVLFVEMVNEPWHRPETERKYVDALVKAVRDTGCRKLTFHNVSQDFRVAATLRDSTVDGTTFGWYPAGLNSGHELKGNFLRYVDDYPAMRDPVLATKPRIVYEFDMPDTNTGYAYPAMARTFRAGGIGMATMFSYDMLATAPFNLGWTTHLLNLVYTPKKAVSAAIAAEAMRRLPAGKTYGAYPANTRFGDFRVSYEEDLAELAAKDAFMYSNSTSTAPPSLGSLRRIVGCGSSPVIRYEGNGAYFLDRLGDGMWRLEVYPDVVQVSDPFDRPSKDHVSFTIHRGTHRMAVNLPDLGPRFTVQGLDRANATHSGADVGSFSVKPGVYLLRSPRAAKAVPPARVGSIGLREFVVPPVPERQNLRDDPVATPPTVLFDPVRDVPLLAVTRSGESRNGPGRLVDAGEGRKALALAAGPGREDFSVSLFVGDRGLRGTKLRVRLRGREAGSKVRVVLVDRDGAAWGAVVAAPATWGDVEVPLSDMRPTRWVLLPQGYPGEWSYWCAAPPGPHTLDPARVERLQFSLRREDAAPAAGVEIAGASMVP